MYRVNHILLIYLWHSYVAAFKKSAYASLEEAGVVGGIQMCAMILYEKPDGKLKIERYVRIHLVSMSPRLKALRSIISKELQAFGKTQAFGSSMVALQKWVEDAVGM